MCRLQSSGPDVLQNTHWRCCGVPPWPPFLGHVTGQLHEGIGSPAFCLHQLTHRHGNTRMRQTQSDHLQTEKKSNKWTTHIQSAFKKSIAMRRDLLQFYFVFSLASLSFPEWVGLFYFSFDCLLFFFPCKVFSLGFISFTVFVPFVGGRSEQI